MNLSKPSIPPHLLCDERVKLAPISDCDIELIRSWRNRDEIRAWFNDSAPIGSTQQQAWFRSYADNPDDLMFLVRRAADMKPVGTVALYFVDRQAGRAEFGRLIVAEARGEGLGYAATIRACRIAFEGMDMKTLTLEVKSANVAARRIYDAAGFSVLADSQRESVRMELHRSAFILQRKDAAHNF